MKNLEQIAAKNLLKRRAKGGKTPKLPRRLLIIYGMKILILLAALGIAADPTPAIRPWGTFILGMMIAALLRDWLWYRSISKGWPVTEKFLNWSIIEASAQGKNTPPPMPIQNPQ